MCGILGVVTARGRRVSVDDIAVARLRDTMAHRGPDGAGLWRHENVVLAHRRLAVVDLSDGAAQPMVQAGMGRGTVAIVYNGELYNDAEVRAELEGADGARDLDRDVDGAPIWRSRSDTETVLRALTVWGVEGLTRLRGMYALGFVDVSRGKLVLARDPLGIKPLYWAMAGHELVFASEPRAALGHPGIGARPDMVSVSGYLTTIRTVTGQRTMFEGVRTLRPGQVLEVDLNSEEVRVRDVTAQVEAARRPRRWDRAQGIEAVVRAAVEDSVRRHLRSDVPLCSLLSGGLDSSVVALLAARAGRGQRLFTYCSGAVVEGAKDDLHFAREVAARLGTAHTEAPVTAPMFVERWREMVGAMGVPLSTPNEVAINEVARRLRADGKVVALSGEGADELFAGYEGPVLDAARFEGLAGGGQDPRPTEPLHPGEFQLAANAWVPLDAKAAALNQRVWRGLEGDQWLRAFYREEFDRHAGAFTGDSANGGEDDRWGEDDAAWRGVQVHLRFQRRINLAGLLQRLDTATMLAGVEGRTPLADVDVAMLAESLPMRWKATVEDGRVTGTKIALRRAFAPDLPQSIVSRPKASFPLPFQEWIGDAAGVLRDSALAKEVFSEAAMETVAANPSKLWQVAWPMINVAMWGKAWWG